MTKHNFKKQSKDTKISLLNVTLDETWWSLIKFMGNVKEGNYTEEKMAEIYDVFCELNSKIKEM